MNERSADVLDEAAALEAKTIESSQAAVRKLTAPQSYRDESGVLITQGKTASGGYRIVECVECGDDLVPERMELGRIYCVVCWSIKEKKDAIRR